MGPGILLSDCLASLLRSILSYFLQVFTYSIVSNVCVVTGFIYLWLVTSGYRPYTCTVSSFGEF